MISAFAHPAGWFQFDRDTFAFANQLLWEYRFDPQTDAMSVRVNQPRPTYSLHCFVMVRSARQFFFHARFDPGRPVAADPEYRRLVRAVVSRNPRRACREEDRIIIPGYDCLRSFSRAQEAVLKACCGGAWQSYVLRSHWRMILPIWRGHQERMARQLARSLAGGRAPIIHLFRFPELTMNHGIILLGVAETAAGLRFDAYDPNAPEHPTELSYDAKERVFRFPRNLYWPGGKVNVVEVFCGWFY